MPGRAVSYDYSVTTFLPSIPVASSSGGGTGVSVRVGRGVASGDGSARRRQSPLGRRHPGASLGGGGSLETRDEGKTVLGGGAMNLCTTVIEIGKGVKYLGTIDSHREVQDRNLSGRRRSLCCESPCPPRVHLRREDEEGGRSKHQRCNWRVPGQPEETSRARPSSD